MLPTWRCCRPRLTIRDNTSSLPRLSVRFLLPWVRFMHFRWTSGRSLLGSCTNRSLIYAVLACYRILGSIFTQSSLQERLSLRVHNHLIMLVYAAIEWKICVPWRLLGVNFEKPVRAACCRLMLIKLSARKSLIFIVLLGGRIWKSQLVVLGCYRNGWDLGFQEVLLV